MSGRMHEFGPNIYNVQKRFRSDRQSGDFLLSACIVLVPAPDHGRTDSPATSLWEEGTSCSQEVMQKHDLRRLSGRSRRKCGAHESRSCRPVRPVCPSRGAPNGSCRKDCPSRDRRELDVFPLVGDGPLVSVIGSPCDERAVRLQRQVVIATSRERFELDVFNLSGMEHCSYSLSPHATSVPP